jgi:hypothetical protein
MTEHAPYVIDPNDPAEVQADKYWRVVGRTVAEVFHGDAGAVEGVRSRLAAQPKGTREKFYQTEPYTVAADIAKEPGAGTPRQQLDYLRIKQIEEFGPVEIPDDLRRAAEAQSRG